MAFDYINEAFKKLDFLDEAMFNPSSDGIRDLEAFMEKEDDTPVRVIDTEATTEEDLKDSYVGKVIINCNVCHSHIFEDKENLDITEDGAVNVEQQCPYCGEQEGFVIIGEITPFNDAAENTEDEPTEEGEQIDVEPASDNTESEVVIEESMSANNSLKMSRASARLNTLSEDFKEVSITTEDQHLEMTSDENGKVTVTTEPVDSAETNEEVLSPVSAETEAEILSNNEVEEEAPLEEIPAEEVADEETDIDFEEVDEEGFDELGESYLRKVYDNVESFKTTNVSANNTTMIVEGCITFNSGVKKNTGFVFEACDLNTRGQLRFKGYNKHLCENTSAYSLIGRVDNKKLFVESLKYNYSVSNTPVRGVVRRK